MSEDFVLCARAIKGSQFISEPGKSVYLQVPDNSDAPLPEHRKSVGEWLKNLRNSSVWGKDSRDANKDRGDILVFIHGYNNDQKTVMQRHRQLKNDLHAVGYKLVTDGIRILAKEQKPDCVINVHLLGHSTGAFVIREAFDDADDTQLRQAGWLVSQIVFIGGDISSDSLSQGNPSTEAIYRHCVRFTNYSNGADSVLKLSNTKRLGVSPRVGRVGLPSDIPEKAVNIDCTDYFNVLNSDTAIKTADQKQEIGNFDHSWYVGNRVFTLDLFEVLKGDLDRHLFPTRNSTSSGIKLKSP